MIKKICVVYGGCSAEREVSIKTGESVKCSLKTLGYQVVCIDVQEDLIELANEIKKIAPDYIFNALHGGAGENGNIQAIFNALKIPYTHSGMCASAIGMNKKTTSNVLKSVGIKVPTFFISKFDDLKNDSYSAVCNKLKALANIQAANFDKFVIKPIDNGSSIGVYIIANQDDLNHIEWNFGNVMIEEYIDGLELTVGVMGQTALAVTEIISQMPFFDYKAKYTKNVAKHVIPADIPDDIYHQAKDIALTAHNALGCTGISRTDMIYRKNDNSIFVLEVNTQPGMTDISLFPEQALYCGISYDQLIEWIVRQACYNH